MAYKNLGDEKYNFRMKNYYIVYEGDSKAAKLWRIVKADWN